MRSGVLTAVFLFGISTGMAGAQMAGQPQATAAHSMNGMEMGKDEMSAMKGAMTSCPQLHPAEAKQPAGVLRLGFCEKSADWTVEALAALPHKTITLYNVHAKANQSYSGVSLFDLLSKLGAPTTPHGKELRLYLVAEGTDGYEAVYSLAEINPDLRDATVLIADAMDGKPLAGNGPFQLVANGEKRPARWVRNLKSVRVLMAE